MVKRKSSAALGKSKDFYAILATGRLKKELNRVVLMSRLSQMAYLSFRLRSSEHVAGDSGKRIWEPLALLYARLVRFFDILVPVFFQELRKLSRVGGSSEHLPTS